MLNKKGKKSITQVIIFEGVFKGSVTADLGSLKTFFPREKDATFSFTPDLQEGFTFMIWDYQLSVVPKRNFKNFDNADVRG